MPDISTKRMIRKLSTFSLRVIVVSRVLMCFWKDSKKDWIELYMGGIPDELLLRSPLTALG
jgi:hypothetical protein